MGRRPVTETLLALVPQWGAWLVMIATFLSCLALPIPASVIMLAAGAFTATGDLSLTYVTFAALAGAVAGDQVGYAVARFGGAGLWDKLKSRKGAAEMLTKVQSDLERSTLPTVFFTRWLFSAFGPYVNAAAGATRLDWRRYTAAGVAGEAVWVIVYVGLGRTFASQISNIGDMMANITGALAMGLVAVLLGRMLWRMAQEKPQGPQE